MVVLETPDFLDCQNCPPGLSVHWSPCVPVLAVSLTGFTPPPPPEIVFVQSFSHVVLLTCCYHLVVLAVLFTSGPLDLVASGQL